MKIKDVMTQNVKYIAPTTTLNQAAKEMQQLDCGFLPISDANGEKLQGVVTDRDIVIRAVAMDMAPNSTTVEQIKTDKVLYCFENDDLEKAAQSMEEQRVYRLIVLNNEQDKKLCGILSLGDILRHNQDSLASEIAHCICEKQAA